MSDSLQKLRIHFGDRIDDKRLSPIARICGFGGSGELSVLKYLNAYDELNQVGPTLWEQSDLEGADVVVFPYQYRRNEDRAKRLAMTARAAGLPFVIFQQGDHSEPVDPGYGMVFRTSIFAAQRTPAEHAMAPPADDMLAGRDGLVINSKADKPRLGFCGNVGNRWLELLYRLVGKSSNIEGTQLRRRVIRLLEKSNRVETSFLLRDKWWGGAVTRSGRDEAFQQRMREEYVRNMLETDYMLCVRGAGNFSFRFYEAMSAGRIPLLINTQCVLPFDGEIDWSQHCVIVEERNIGQAADALAAFHEALSPERFENMQRANRGVWNDWLRPIAFYQQAFRKAREALASAHR